MGKLPGRNDPCPCGSGRKFKKCHLQGIQMWQRLAAHPQLDATEAKIAFCLAMEGRNLLREVERQGDALQRECFGSYAEGTILMPEDAEGPLRKWLHRLEQELGRLAGTDSRYFWLFLTQRIRPTTRRFDVTELTVELYRQILKLAILKYGRASGTPFTSLPDDYSRDKLTKWVMRLDGTALPLMEPVPNSSAMPVSVSIDDIFKAFLMERLARDFCGATALLRRIWKGGRLPIIDGHPGNAVHDPDTDWLIDLYDERLSYSRVLSHFGSIASPEFARGRVSNLLCLIPRYNLEETRIPLVWRAAASLDDEFSRLFRDAEYCPNYIVVPANLDDFLRKVKGFRSALTDVHGFPPEDLICFFVGLSYRELMWWSERPRRHLQLFQRGYAVVVNEDGFVNDLAWFYSAASAHLGPAVSEEGAREKIATVAAALRYEDTNFDKIELWTRSGLKLILPTDSGVLIDFHAIPEILSHFFEPLAKMSGEVGQLKGKDFEREVAVALENGVPGAQVIWRGKVVARSTPCEREVDLGVVKDDTLFILECKAHALDPAFERGEPEALEKRRALNVRTLRQTDSLAEFLAANPKGKNYEVLDGVSFVASAAVSPFPEYIDERSEMLFLLERTPRVCTPEEMVHFMMQFQANDYAGKPWLFEVQRSPEVT